MSKKKNVKLETAQMKDSAPAKKRGKIRSLSPVGMMVIAAVATLAAVPLRTFQLTSLVDPETGFWLAQDITVPVLGGIILGVIVLAFFLTLLSGIMPEPDIKQKKSGIMGVVGLIMTAGFAYEAVTDAFSGYGLVSAYDPVSSAATVPYYLMSTGALPKLLQAFFGILAALYFALYAISEFSGSGMYKKHKVLALNPVFWALFRLIAQFVNPISYKNVSQLMLELVYLCFALIFFLSFARLASHVNEKSSMWILYFAGISSAFAAFVTAGAPLALLVTGKGDLICPTYPLHYVDLAFAVFATGVLLQNLPVTVKATSADDFPVGTPDEEAAEEAAAAVVFEESGAIEEDGKFVVADGAEEKAEADRVLPRSKHDRSKKDPMIIHDETAVSEAAAEAASETEDTDETAGV